MNNQNTADTTIFQDRDLLALTPTAPANSWQRLNAGDEKAESFETFLRMMLVATLLCTLMICALRLRPASDDANDLRFAAPSVNLQQMIGHAPATAVKAGNCAF